MSSDDLSPNPENLSIGDRLILLIGDESISSFARRAGVSEGILRKYITGSNPGGDILIKISEASGCTTDWILTGKQPMFRSGSIAFEIDPAGNPSPVIGLVKTYLSANENQQELIRMLIEAIERPRSKAWYDVGLAVSKAATIFPPKKK